jgi:hypothetical protein
MNRQLFIHMGKIDGHYYVPVVIIVILEIHLLRHAMVLSAFWFLWLIFICCYLTKKMVLVIIRLIINCLNWLF